MIRADPHAIDRDHHAKRALTSGAPLNHIGQLACPGCGAWFLLRSTLARHREAEIPRFRAAAEAKAREWDKRRRRAPTLVSRERIAELERLALGEPGPLRVVGPEE